MAGQRVAISRRKYESLGARPRRSAVSVLSDGAAIALVAAVACGCAAIYPELSSPVRPVPVGKELTPPPPKTVRYIVFKRAEIPPLTRDGRKWDRYGGSAPDPFAKVLLDGKELILTPVQSNTLTPTWPDQKRANYVLGSHPRVRIELWDSNPISNHPICVKVVRNLDEEIVQDTLSLTCDSGAHIDLTIAPARPKLGLGLYYELRTNDIGVTRVVRESPASRSGIRKGDQIVRIQGRDVKNMDEGEAKSLINAHARSGLSLLVRHENGKVQDVTLKEGPMYPTIDEGIPLDP